MITVARKHSLGIAAARKNVQSWLDYNYLWEPRVRINRLRYEWTAANQLKVSGKVGQSGYTFDATMLIEPDKITVTATDPPTVYVGASAGWDDELKKILGLPATLPVRTVIELDHSWDPKALLGRLDRWVNYASGGNRRWVDASGSTTIKPAVASTVENVAGLDPALVPVRQPAAPSTATLATTTRSGPPLYKGYFFYQLTDKATGQPRQSPAYWGQGEVYGILTIMPGKVTLEVPQGLAEGRDARAKSWEAMLSGQLSELVGSEPGVGALGAKVKAAAKKVAAVVTATPGSEAKAAAAAKDIQTMSKKLALAIAGKYPALVSKIAPTPLEAWFSKLTAGWSKDLGPVTQIQAMPKQGNVVFMAFFGKKGSRTYTMPVAGADKIVPTTYWTVSNKGVVKEVPVIPAGAKVPVPSGAKPPSAVAVPRTVPVPAAQAQAAGGGGSGLAIALGLGVLGVVLVAKKKRR